MSTANFTMCSIYFDMKESQFQLRRVLYTFFLTLKDGSRGIPPRIPRNPPPPPILPPNPPRLTSPSLDHGCWGSNNDANVELTSLLPTVTVEDFDAPDGFPGNNRCGIV